MTTPNTDLAECAIEECERKRSSRGWCRMHYQRWARHGDPLAGGPTRERRDERMCSVEGCERPIKGRGWCGAHYSRWRVHGDPRGGEPERKPRAVPPCSVGPCDRPSYGNGYCSMHYQRAVRNGDPGASGYAHFEDPEEAFAARTRKDGDCLVWTGRLNDDGYGRVRMPEGDVRSHRYAWERVHGPIPDGLIVRHKCDNPPCVNIEHLELGTVKDNNYDAIARGRAWWQRGDTR